MPNSNNHDTLVIHRSFRSVLPYVLLACIGAVACLVLPQTPEAWGLSFTIAGVELYLPIALLVFLVLVARPVVLMYDEHYEVSRHHIRTTSGIFSLKRRDVNVPLEELRGVRADQGILARIFGVGDVLAWSHNGHSPEVRMHGIRHPRKIATLIAERIDHALIKKNSGNSKLSVS